MNSEEAIIESEETTVQPPKVFMPSTAKEPKKVKAKPPKPEVTEAKAPTAKEKAEIEAKTKVNKNLPRTAVHGGGPVKGSTKVNPPALAKLPARGTVGNVAPYKESANRFRLVADPVRCMILDILKREEDMIVGEICAEIGQSQPAVSHHLGLLRMCEFIYPTRVGKTSIYRLTEKGRYLANMVEASQGE